MSFEDTIFLIGGIFAIIAMVMILHYAYTSVMAPISSMMPGNTSAQLNATEIKTVNFIDGSIAAMFFMFSAGIIALTAYLSGNPAALALWLILNIVMVLVWDVLDQTLTSIEGSVLNTGILSQARLFFHNVIPKAAVGVNILLGCALFGKKVFLG